MIISLGFFSQAFKIPQKTELVPDGPRPGCQHSGTQVEGEGQGASTFPYLWSHSFRHRISNVNCVYLVALEPETLYFALSREYTSHIPWGPGRDSTWLHGVGKEPEVLNTS
jgi:hypothetical protein